MQVIESAQYHVPAIELEESDFTTGTATEIFNALKSLADEEGAYYYEDDGEGKEVECFVLDFGRGVGPELYTETATKRSIEGRVKKRDKEREN
jgi:hypothetical protein